MKKTIRELMNFAGINEEEVAKALGVKLSTVNKIINRLLSPTATQTKKLLDLFEAKGYSIQLDIIDFSLAN